MINKQQVYRYKAQHPEASFNQIYVKGNRPFAVYIAHSHKVFNKGEILIIHALTAAIRKAVRLSITLRKQYPYLCCQMHTDSVPTIIQLEDGTKTISEKSAIHIVLKKNKISQLQ